jgi:hypothetical protein
MINNFLKGIIEKDSEKIYGNKMHRYLLIIELAN